MKKYQFLILCYMALVCSAIWNVVEWATPTNNGIALDLYTVVVFALTLFLYEPLKRGLEEMQNDD